MDLTIAFLAALIGYLAGSLSFARIITRLAAPQADLSSLRVQLAGSGESTEVGIMGANAASMVLGARLGLLVAGLDMLKVVVPMVVFRALYPGQPYHLVVAVGGLAGHNWTVFHGFKGGRGFAVIFASFLLVDWAGGLLSVLAGLLFGMTILGNPFIAYLAWLPLMILWMAWRHGPPEVAYSIVVIVLFVISTLPEIRLMLRLRREGKYQAYLDGLYNSSPRWRGMKKMADRLWLLRPLFRRHPATGNQPPESPAPGNPAP